MTTTDDPAEGPLTPPPISDEQQVGPELVATIERLVDAVAGQPAHADVAARLESLIELLIGRGHLAPGHRALLRRIKAGAATGVRLSVLDDKRTVPSSGPDCASLLPLCKGRCCAMDVSLSERDLAERTLRWDVRQPYLLAKNPDHGYCAYLGDGGRCDVYDERPGTCRAYDCRRDPRVWIDFEGRIPAPMPWHLAPELWMGDGEAQGGADGDAGPTTSAG